MTALHAAALRPVENEPDPRLDSEQMIIAAVLTDAPGTMLATRAGRELEPRDFKCPGHALIFAAALEEIRHWRQPTHAGVEAALRSQGATEAIEALRCVPLAAFPEAARDCLQALLDAPAEEPASNTGLPTVLLPVARLLDTPFAPVEYAIAPYFPRQELTEAVGAHGIFKSTAMLDAGLSVATGRPWCLVPVTQGRAVFITMEDGERTLSRRVRAWLEGVPAGKERSDAEADLRANFAYLAREQAQDLALTATDRHSTVIRASVVARLSELLAGSVFVVLETASRLHDGPEMNEALAVFARAVERIATETGAAVVIVRHVSKAAAREQVVDSYAGRGGGALSDAARSVLVMTRDRKGDEEEGEPDPLAPVRLTHAKSTHAPQGPRLVWKPVATEHGVYLQPLSAAEEIRDDAQRLLQFLRDRGEEGITTRALHNDKPAGLGRARAKAALGRLLEQHLAEPNEERRGGQRCTVYRVKGGER